MSLIIDGYNLLYVSRFAPTSNRAKLKSLRDALLHHLADRIDGTKHKYVAIVFDSERKPSEDSSELTFRHLKVYFAYDHVTRR